MCKVSLGKTRTFLVFPYETVLPIFEAPLFFFFFIYFAWLSAPWNDWKERFVCLFFLLKSEEVLFMSESFSMEGIKSETLSPFFTDLRKTVNVCIVLSPDKVQYAF